ncbi:MAG: hypothetical protein HY670_02515 [Chloroflexi bacterium]|nr:hypothetical protein [Chloroflexota bacterium]
MLGLKMIITGVTLFSTLVAAPAATVTVLNAQQQVPKEVTTTYDYDAAKERWVKNVEAIKLTPGPDGEVPKSGNTIIVNLDKDNPVKNIIIDEALIIKGTSPLLEIKGHDESIVGATGRINIGTLAFVEVDAEELDIDADVVRTEVENVVAEDNELDLDLNVVNVVRTGRGATSSLFFGVSRSQLNDELELLGLLDTSVTTGRTVRGTEAGLRVDRIRILGPQSNTAFVERIVIRRSSVFGRIEVKDVAIQDLIIKKVSLDDSP